MKTLKYVLILSVIATGLSVSLVSQAGNKGTKKGEYVNSYCKEENASCGGIGYVNKGGYVVDWVRVKAVGTEKQPQGYNSKCSGLEKKLTVNLALGDYDEFTVPATCRYEIKIDIKAGENKDRDLTLTPGCIFATKSAGTTTLDNKIKKQSRSFVDGLDPDVKAYGEANCKLH